MFIVFFMNACGKVQPGTHCANNTNINGKVIDSMTMKPIEDVYIIQNIHIFRLLL